jgi:hypothetical protein
MRVFVLIVALVFIALFGTLTVYVFIHDGVSADGVVAVLVLILFAVGIVGALRHPPRE